MLFLNEIVYREDLLLDIEYYCSVCGGKTWLLPR